MSAEHQHTSGDTPSNPSTVDHQITSPVDPQAPVEFIQPVDRDDQQHGHSPGAHANAEDPSSSPAAHHAQPPEHAPTPALTPGLAIDLNPSIDLNPPTSSAPSDAAHLHAGAATPSHSAHLHVPTSIPPDSAHLHVPTSTPPDSVHLLGPTCSPPDSAHLHIPTSAPSDSAHLQLPMSTPSDSAHLQMPTSTPSDAVHLHIPVTSTLVHIPTSAPSDAAHDHIPTSAPSDSAHMHIPTSAPSDSAHMHIPTSGPLDSAHMHIPTSGPLDSTHMHIPTSAPSDSTHMHIPTSAPSDSVHLHMPSSSPSDAAHLHVPVSAPPDTADLHISPPTPIHPTVPQSGATAAAVTDMPMTLVNSPATTAAAAVAAAAAGVSPETVASVMAATAAAAAAAAAAVAVTSSTPASLLASPAAAAPVIPAPQLDATGNTVAAEPEPIGMEVADVVMTESAESPDTPSRSCVALQVQQKQVVYEEYMRRKRANEPIDQQGLATWAMQKFGLSARPSQSTISRILKTVGSTSKHTVLRGVNKRNRLTGNPQLEQALHAWINAQFAARRSVNGSLIVDAARRIQDRMNAELPPEKRVNMKFSNGWLQKFKQRCTLSSFKSSGDSSILEPTNDGGSAVAVETAITNATMVSIKANLRTMAKRDVWCAHEFGHCYKMSPERASVDDNMGAAKSDRTRVTYLACTNSDGSEKVPLVIIGRSVKPKSFEGKTRDELDFDYHHSQDALMTSTIFFEWLLRFDNYIERSQAGRKVALLLESCTIHGTTETLPRLEHVKVFFLPSQREPKRLPLDGVIHALKARYRKRQYEMALDNLDAARQNIYHIDLLTAIRVMNDIWNRLDRFLIMQFWYSSDIVDDFGEKKVDVKMNGSEGGTGKGNAGGVDYDIVSEINRLVLSLVPPVTLSRIRVEDLINPASELNYLQSATEEELATSAAAALIAKDETNVDDDDENCCFMDGSLPEKLRSLVVVKHLFLKDSAALTAVVMEIERVQGELRHARDRGARQSGAGGGKGGVSKVKQQPVHTTST